MGVSAYLESVLLNYACRGDASNTPSAWAVGLADIAGNEITDLNYQRQSVSFDPATNGTATVGVEMRFGPFLVAQTPTQMQLWDSTVNGNLLWQAPLDDPSPMVPNEGVVFPIGDIAVTLA